MTSAAGAHIHRDAIDASLWRAWRVVASVLPAGAYLGGGTALALQLGHRRSFDLDVFCPDDLDGPALIMDLRTQCAARKLGFAVDTMTAHRFAGRLDSTKVEYTHEPSPLLGATTLVAGLPVASLDDIVAMKVAAVTDRGALRDWYDLMIVQQRAGLSHRDCYLLYCERYLERHGHTVGQFYRSVHGSGHDDRCQLKHRPIEVPACQAYRWRCTNARRSAAR